MNEYALCVAEDLRRRYAHEPEYLQAVLAWLELIDPALGENPEYERLDLLARMVEPDRIVTFLVPWVDDQGRTHTNHGYRVQFSNALGPYKGGLRFQPGVNLSVVKFLGFEQTYKNALIGLPVGGAAGGADFDPRGRSRREVMRFLPELHDRIVPLCGGGHRRARRGHRRGGPGDRLPLRGLQAPDRPGGAGSPHRQGRYLRWQQGPPGGGGLRRGVLPVPDAGTARGDPGGQAPGDLRLRQHRLGRVPEGRPAGREGYHPLRPRRLCLRPRRGVRPGEVRLHGGDARRRGGPGGALRPPLRPGVLPGQKALGGAGGHRDALRHPERDRRGGRGPHPGQPGGVLRGGGQYARHARTPFGCCG